MVLLWLMDAAAAVIGWLLDLFPTLPTFTLPSPLSITVPVPLMGSAVGGLNTWAVAGVAVSLILVAGKVIQWVYSLIPLKAT